MLGCPNVMAMAVSDDPTQYHAKSCNKLAHPACKYHIFHHRCESLTPVLVVTLSTTGCKYILDIDRKTKKNQTKTLIVASFWYYACHPQAPVKKTMNTNYEHSSVVNRRPVSIKLFILLFIITVRFDSECFSQRDKNEHRKVTPAANITKRYKID